MSFEDRLTEMPTEENWDSYGGHPTTEAAKRTARMLAPVPTSNGGIGLIWHCAGADVEIEIGPDGDFTMVSWGKAGS